jgi:hypothetical protein
MNARQRFLESLSFGSPDKIPFEPGWPRESTLRVWKDQGLPENVDWCCYLLDILGIYNFPKKSGHDLDVKFAMIPQFEEKVIEHINGHYIVQDWMGAITEISDQYDFTYLRMAKDFVTRKWHKFPVEAQQDWEEKISWRYDPKDTSRFPVDFAQQVEQLQQRDFPLKLSINGPFWQLREWCGFAGLCTLMIEDEKFIHRMVLYWQKFVLEMLSCLLKKIVPDFVMINEDMAFKLHSMISPRMVKKYLLPTWKAWNVLLKSSGVPLVFIDSDGFIGELIPLWIEAGFDGCFPVEVAAGNDILVYRQEHRKKMAFIGGIDKRSLAAGGKPMLTEVLRVVPPLMKEGGIIPGCDHGVPPDVSWSNFVEYSQILARLTGWIE